MAEPDYLLQLERRLTEEGKLVEAGWIGLRIAVMPPDAGKEQLDDMRTAFYAGAQHLFASLLRVMDADREPTEDDLHRMTLIADELNRFRLDFEKRPWTLR